MEELLGGGRGASFLLGLVGPQSAEDAGKRGRPRRLRMSEGGSDRQTGKRFRPKCCLCSRRRLPPPQGDRRVVGRSGARPPSASSSLALICDVIVPRKKHDDITRRGSSVVFFADRSRRLPVTFSPTALQRFLPSMHWDGGDGLHPQTLLFLHVALETSRNVRKPNLPFYHFFAAFVQQCGV